MPDNPGDTQLKLEIERNIHQKTESVKFVHRWFKRAYAAGLGFVLAAFIVALYVSIAWKSVVSLVIPIAWFIFAASFAPLAILIGLDTILVQAFPPVFLPLRPMNFVSGREAVFTGFGVILMALVLAGFWGLFSYAVLTINMVLIEIIVNIIGVLFSIGIGISILQSFLRRFSARY